MGKVSFVNKQDRLREYEMRYLFARKEAFEAKAAVLQYCFALNKSTEALQPEKKKEIVKKLFGEEVLRKLEENIKDLGNEKKLKGIKDSDKCEKFIKDKQAKFFNRTKKGLGLSEDQRLYMQAVEKDGAFILKRRSGIASGASKEDDVIGYIHHDVFRKDKASIEDAILLDEQKKEGLLESASWPLFVDLCFSITIAEIAKNAAEALKTPVSEKEIAELEKELEDLQIFMSNLPEDNLNNLSDEDKKKAERFYAIAKIIKDNAPADSTVQEQVPEDKTKYFEWLKNLLKSGKSKIVKFFGSIKVLFKEHASKVASEDKNQQIKKESEDQVNGVGEAAVEATDDKQVAAKVETAKEATKSDSKGSSGGGGSRSWFWALGGVAAVGGGIFALRKLLKTSNKKNAALRDVRREYAHANFSLNHKKEKSGSYFRKINEGENMVSKRRLEQQKRIYIDARHDAHVHYLDTINYCNQVARAKNGTTVNFSIFPFFGNRTPRALTDQMCGSSEVRQIQEQIYRDFQDPNALAAVNRAMNEIKNGGCNAERTKQSLERLADCCPDRKTGAKLVTAAQRLGSQLSSEGWFFDGISSKKDRQAKSKEFQDIFVNTADKVAKTKESGWLAGIWNSLKEWADDNKALAIIAGICVAGIITYSVYRLWKAHAKKQVALRNARQQLALMQPGLMAPPAPGIVPQGAMAPALPGSMTPPALPPAPPMAMKQIPQAAMPATLPKAAFGRDKYNYNFARDFDDYWEELE